MDQSDQDSLLQLCPQSTLCCTFQENPRCYHQPVSDQHKITVRLQSHVKTVAGPCSTLGFEGCVARLILVSRSLMPDSNYTKCEAHHFIELLHATVCSHPPSHTYSSMIQILTMDFQLFWVHREYDVLNSLISKHLPLLSNLHMITISYVTARIKGPHSLIGSSPLSHLAEHHSGKPT